MQGISRTSLQTLQEQLPERSAGKGATDLAADLLAVSGLLQREAALRAALTDPGADPAARAQLATGLLQNRVSASATLLVADAARLAWSGPRDLTEAMEILGASTAFLNAERNQTIDAVEDELFRFGRILSSQSELRSVLDDGSGDPDAKMAVLQSLLSGRVQPTTLALLEHVLRDRSARRFSTGLERLIALAAQRREEMVAEVEVAAPLEPEQERRLAALLGQIYSRSRVRLQVAVDPTLLGGVVVRVGTEVLDGSIAHRLHQARRQFAG